MKTNKKPHCQCLYEIENMLPRTKFCSVPCKDQRLILKAPVVNEFAFKTGQEMGLTETEIAVKADELLLIAEKETIRQCPDCGINPGSFHRDGCDIAKCTKCGTQVIVGCNCNSTVDIWTGLWPGTMECYTNKFICYSVRSGWMFDYNTLAKHK